MLNIEDSCIVLVYILICVFIIVLWCDSVVCRGSVRVAFDICSRVEGREVIVVVLWCMFFVIVCYWCFVN